MYFLYITKINLENTINKKSKDKVYIKLIYLPE